MTTDTEVLEADLTWTGAAFEAGVRVAVRSGRIEGVGALEAAPTRRLVGRALLPGMVNAHSHAFQWGLRGRGETFPEEGGTFWTWREAMYDLVGSMDRDRLFELCRRCYREMLARGITTVGEFHYLHHDRADDFAFDETVLAAARSAGIRLVLLNAYYRTGGIGRPLAGAQRRFATPTPAAYWEQLDRLGATLDSASQTLGAVVHSMRAADPAELAGIHDESRRRGVAFHIHLEEQRREIDDCRAAYGTTPMRLLLDRCDQVDNITAIHCTHTDDGEMGEFLERGGRVCVCPLTEANLGDGLPGLDRLAGRGDRLALGSDSNARIDPFEEMRWLEYGQRVRRERRGVLRDETGAVAPTLWRAATEGGAASLGLTAGRIATGMTADFCTLDLGSPLLGEWDDASLLAAVIFGAGCEAVGDVCVGGRWIEGDPRRGEGPE